MSVESFITKHLPGCPQGNPGELRAAADCWTNVAGSLRTTTDDAKGRIATLTASWQGSGKTAFEQEWGKLADAVNQGCDEMASVAQHLRKAADDLEAAQYAYQLAISAAAVTAVVGIGLTLVTFGASDAVAGEEVATEVGVAVDAAAEATSLAARLFSLACDIAVQLGRAFQVFGFVDLGADAAVGAIVSPDHNPLDHIDYTAVTALALGSLAPELRVGGPLAKIIFGGVAAGGVDAASQELTTGHIDPGEVLFNAGLGSLAAGAIVGAGRLRLIEEPAPGERSMTREEWQADQTRRRAEQSVAGVDQPLENPSPNAAPTGHGHGRHGYQTTEADQETRVRTGVAPDGEPAPAERASRFRSPEAEAEALGRARTKLEAKLQSSAVTSYTDPVTGHQVYVNPANGRPVRHPVQVTTNDPRGFGESAWMPRRISGPNGAYVLDPAGNRIPYQEVVPQMNARVVYEYVRSANEWRPITYFPEP